MVRFSTNSTNGIVSFAHNEKIIKFGIFRLKPNQTEHFNLKISIILF